MADAYEKIDDTNFYKVNTVKESISVDKIKETISQLQARIDELTAMLQGAEKIGVNIGN